MSAETAEEALTQIFTKEFRMQFATDAQLDATLAQSYEGSLTPEEMVVARKLLRTVMCHEA